MIGGIVPNSARVLRADREGRKKLSKKSVLKSLPGVYMTIELLARKEFNKSIDELAASDWETVVELAKKLYPGLPTIYISRNCWPVTEQDVITWLVHAYLVICFVPVSFGRV